MGNEKKTPVTINDVEYFFEDLTQEQQTLFNHVVDLDRKLGSARFNVDQLQVGRNAFGSLLEQSMLPKPEEVPAAESTAKTAEAEAAKAAAEAAETASKAAEASAKQATLRGKLK